MNKRSNSSICGICGTYWLRSSMPRQELQKEETVMQALGPSGTPPIRVCQQSGPKATFEQLRELI